MTLYDVLAKMDADAIARLARVKQYLSRNATSIGYAALDASRIMDEAIDRILAV